MSSLLKMDKAEEAKKPATTGGHDSDEEFSNDFLLQMVQDCLTESRSFSCADGEEGGEKSGAKAAADEALASAPPKHADPTPAAVPTSRSPTGTPVSPSAIPMPVSPSRPERQLSQGANPAAQRTISHQSSGASLVGGDNRAKKMATSSPVQQQTVSPAPVPLAQPSILAGRRFNSRKLAPTIQVQSGDGDAGGSFSMPSGPMSATSDSFRVQNRTFSNGGSAPPTPSSTKRKAELSPADQSRLERTIHLMGIDAQQPAKTLFKLVSSNGRRTIRLYRFCGEVTDRHTTRYAFVEMGTREEALQCVEQLHLKNFGANILQCHMARSPIYQGSVYNANPTINTNLTPTSVGRDGESPKNILARQASANMAHTGMIQNPVMDNSLRHMIASPTNLSMSAESTPSSTPPVGQDGTNGPVVSPTNQQQVHYVLPPVYQQLSPLISPQHAAMQQQVLQQQALLMQAQLAGGLQVVSPVAAQAAQAAAQMQFPQAAVQAFAAQQAAQMNGGMVPQMLPSPTNQNALSQMTMQSC